MRDGINRLVMYDNCVFFICKCAPLHGCAPHIGYPLCFPMQNIRSVVLCSGAFGEEDSVASHRPCCRVCCGRLPVNNLSIFCVMP